MLVFFIASVWVSSARANEWQNDIALSSNYIFRGFSYSGEKPVVQAQSTWRFDSGVSLRGFVSSIEIGSEKGREVRLGAVYERNVYTDLNLTVAMDTTDYDGLLPNQTETSIGFTYRRGRGYLKSTGYFEIAEQKGSRTVDVEIGWRLDDQSTATFAWGNTRSFALLGNDDHDFYRFRYTRGSENNAWMITFERAYDTGVTSPVSNDQRLVATYVYHFSGSEHRERMRKIRPGRW